MDEVLTRLKTHADPRVAAETAAFFMGDRVEVVEVGWASEKASRSSEHDFLSFTDSTTLAAAKAGGIKNIATLDEDVSKPGFSVILEWRDWDLNHS